MTNNGLGRVSPAELLGRWQNDSSDESTESEFGSVVQEFFPDGVLLYAARVAKQTGVLDLRYTLDGDWLITDQPSSPREERTRVAITDDGRLVIGTDPPVFFVKAPGARLPDLPK